MKRIKRVLTQDGHPGILDLHSANQFNQRDGYVNSALLYLEHFPYVNRLWFGEYFDYERSSPDFYLTEVSGIPFGLMGEMLEGGGNPWRGLVFGMTNRMPWSETADPRPIWKVWDEFGMEGARMIGWWVDDGAGQDRPTRRAGDELRETGACVGRARELGRRRRGRDARRRLGRARDRACPCPHHRGAHRRLPGVDQRRAGTEDLREAGPWVVADVGGAMRLTRGIGGALLVALAALPGPAAAQSAATVREYQKIFTTYPFSDPNPIAAAGRIYPYFRFDGYTDVPVQQSWTVVELENDYIRVQVLPQVGGKIWTAVDKASGRDFLYNNGVVKFRDIAMRGPWTSGGIEANYGIVGHTPNCATPVDYVTRTHPDGSASVTIGVLDLLTRTPWRLEVTLPADRAYFTTRSHWQNTTPLEQPYYTWMNVGLKAAGDLQFVYPGTHYLGHDGSASPWPRAPAERQGPVLLRQNDFGPYKSYHVFGRYSQFFGAYWHDQDFGMARYSSRDDKPGKKILDLGTVAPGNDLGATAHRRQRTVRRGAVGPPVQPGSRRERAHAVQAPRVRSGRDGPVDGVLVPGEGHEGAGEGE